MEYLETLQENVGQWAFIMKQQFMNAGLPEARWVSKAAEGFKGYALGWYIKIYGHKSAVKQSEFITILEKTFEPAGCTAILQQQLDHLSCKGRTFLEYITEFCHLSEKVSDTEEAWIYKFVKGLSSQTANEVVQRAPATLEAAIDVATLYEARKASLNKIFFQLSDKGNDGS